MATGGMFQLLGEQTTKPQPQVQLQPQQQPQYQQPDLLRTFTSQVEAFVSRIESFANPKHTTKLPSQ